MQLAERLNEVLIIFNNFVFLKKKKPFTFHGSIARLIYIHIRGIYFCFSVNFSISMLSLIRQNAIVYSHLLWNRIVCSIAYHTNSKIHLYAFGFFSFCFAFKQMYNFKERTSFFLLWTLDCESRWQLIHTIYPPKTLKTLTF